MRFLLVSRSLWESLGSVEDEKTRRRREKQRRHQRNREQQRGRNREGGSRKGPNRDRNNKKKNRGSNNKKTQQLTTTTTTTPQPSVDCWAEHRTAMEAGRARQGSGGGGRSSAHYVPACKTDGTFEQVQCYKVRNMKSTGYGPSNEIVGSG